MKHIIAAAAAVFLLCVLPGCKSRAQAGGVQETFDKEASYALGMNIGSSLKTDELYPNIDEFIKGMQDTLSGAQPRYTMEQAYQILNEAFNSLTAQRETEYRQVENEFLAENSKKPGVSVTPSGLQYEVIYKLDGPKPTASDTVRVHYEGSLINGTVFDSSYYRGEPAEFGLGGVIPGWNEGLQLMGVGSKYRLFVPSDLGYGPQGMGPQIPPYSTLIFEVELLDIVR